MECIDRDGTINGFERKKMNYLYVSSDKKDVHVETHHVTKDGGKHLIKEEDVKNFYFDSKYFALRDNINFLKREIPFKNLSIEDLIKWQYVTPSVMSPKIVKKFAERIDEMADKDLDLHVDVNRHVLDGTINRHRYFLESLLNDINDACTPSRSSCNPVWGYVEDEGPHEFKEPYISKGGKKLFDTHVYERRHVPRMIPLTCDDDKNCDLEFTISSPRKIQCNIHHKMLELVPTDVSLVTGFLEGTLKSIAKDIAGKEFKDPYFYLNNTCRVVPDDNES